MAPTVDFGPVKYGCTKYKRRMVLYESVSHAGKRFEFCYSSSYRDKKGIETAYYKCVGCMHAKRYNDGRRIPKIAVRETRLVNSNPDRPSNFPHFCQPIDSAISERRQREREIANPQPIASKSESAESNARINIINPPAAEANRSSCSSAMASSLSSYKAASYYSSNRTTAVATALQPTQSSSSWFESAVAAAPFGHSFASSASSNNISTHTQMLPPSAYSAFSSSQIQVQQQHQQHFEAVNTSNNNAAPSSVQTVQAVQQQIQQLAANCWFQPTNATNVAAAAASQHFLLGVGMAAAAGGWPPPPAPVAAPIPSSRTHSTTTPTILLPHQPHRS